MKIKQDYMEPYIRSNSLILLNSKLVYKLIKCFFFSNIPQTRQYYRFDIILTVLGKYRSISTVFVTVSFDNENMFLI